MQALLERGRRVAERGKARAVARTAGLVRNQVRGISVEVTNDGIVLRGRRLMARWLNDPALRFAGWRRG